MRIEHLDILSDKYKEKAYKEGEIKRFKVVFGANIIRDDYTSEKELENDWNEYLSLPYGLKVLANERCLRLYGKKNEEQYIEQRKKFLHQDIPLPGHDIVYRPSGFTEDAFDDEEDKLEFMNKLAKKYMDNGGHTLLLVGYDSLSDLNKAYYEFNNQCDDHKAMANDKSIEIYGCKVQDIYNKEIHKFLMQDIKDTAYDQSLKPVVVDSLSATEAVYDVFYHSTDFMEKVVLAESALKEATTPVENSIAEDMQDRLLKEMTDEDYLGRYNYLLPWEIMKVKDQYYLESNPLFVNYYARALGLKPLIRDFQEQLRVKLSESKDKDALIDIGWNPILEFNEQNHKIASKRANDIIREHCHYQFIDLSKSPDMLTEEEEKKFSSFHYGISVLILKEMDQDAARKDADIPKVFVTLDYTNPFWHELKAGLITTTKNIDEVIKEYYTTPLVTCFFIELEKDMYDRLVDTDFEEFNNKNEFQTVCRMLKTASMPNIANKKLFMMNLINMFLYNCNDTLAMRFNKHLDDSKDVIHILYDQLNGSYQAVKDSYSKLRVYDAIEDLQEATVFKNCNFIALTESNINMEKLSSQKDDWDSWQGFLDLFNEYIDYGALNKQWRDKGLLSVDKNDVQNATGSTNRWRQIGGLMQKANVETPRSFNYNGMQSDYDQQVRTIANPREKMQLNRLEDKIYLNKINVAKNNAGLGPKDKLKTLPPRNEPDKPTKEVKVFVPNINAIGTNTGKINVLKKENPNYNSDYTQGHEMEHYYQNHLAKNLKGVQGARQMWNNYHKDVKKNDGTNYKKNPLEFGANATAINKQNEGNLNYNKRAVLQHIQTKNLQGNKINIDNTTANAVYNAVQSMSNDPNKKYPPINLNNYLK